MEEPGLTPQSESDPLVSNGLGSPSCKGDFGEALPAAAERNCRTSGFAAAPAPTGDYGIDVHIDTGVLSVGSWGSTIVQDLFVAPLWMALVWAIHALIVMLEWSFTIDLLDSATVAAGRGLRHMQATLTQVWLPLVLALASILALYHGLVRRRVAQTLGEALLMAAMTIGGTWVIADPSGTVGVLGQWANQASLGTLAVAAQGNPSSPSRMLSASLGEIFTTAIEEPWCYMEFGNVDWCRQPSQLDPRLRAAGLRIAGAQTTQTPCPPGAPVPVGCGPSTPSAPSKTLEDSSQLLRAARSNGALFLALPANGPARNSINEPRSLLRALCGSYEATNCRGPTAAQAEFRTGSGTLWRMGGVVLIAAGLLGMLLLLGHLAVRLLTAAIFSLLYLLLAPAMVLLPALGASGRSVFRGWAARLLGAVVTKLLFSVLLGVMLAVTAILANLGALGWWTQWLLMSAFWWTAYGQRHHVVGIAEGALAARSASSRLATHRQSTRRVREVMEGRRLLATAHRVKLRRERPGPEIAPRVEPTRQSVLASHADDQAMRLLENERRAATAPATAQPPLDRDVAGKRAQLIRLEHERVKAQANRDTRRALTLSHRASRVERQLARLQDDGARARDVDEGARTPQALRERLRERTRFLDAQLVLPGATRKRRAGEGRDYAALAGLLGRRAGDYERLDPRSQRTARLEIDRELDRRKQLPVGAREPAASVAHRAATQDEESFVEDRPAQHERLGIGRP